MATAQGDARGHCLLTGGTANSKDLGKKLDNIGLSDLGRAKKSSSTRTIPRSSKVGKAADIKGRIEQIRREIENTKSDYDREKLEERVAKLAGGVAKINVGRVDRVGDERKEGPG